MHLTHPHFEYPQFRQVWQPSSRTRAWVLHLPQSCAPGGKSPAVSDCASLASAEALGPGLRRDDEDWDDEDWDDEDGDDGWEDEDFEGEEPTIAPPISPAVATSAFFFEVAAS